MHVPGCTTGPVSVLTGRERRGTLAPMDTTPSPPSASPRNDVWRAAWASHPPDDAETEHPPFRPSRLETAGDLVRGRFAIVRPLGAGTAARVYLATDRELFGREVALKILNHRSPHMERRFITEAEVLSNVEHPNLVRALAFGRTGESEDGYLFMALQYVPGLTLEKQLMDRKWFPWREVIEIGIQLANVVQALHDAGVIHRDIKPPNIGMYATPNGPRVKLLDLGVAFLDEDFRAAQATAFAHLPPRHQTELGYAVGTHIYCPPDARAFPRDPGLDVWALAATLYQLATGALPEQTSRRPIAEVVPENDAPEALSDLLLSALLTDRGDRLASASALERGLMAVRDTYPAQPPKHLFGGCFDLLEPLGAGSNAVAQRASDRYLSRECVVKKIDRKKAGEDAVIRFRRSAKILSALENPAIPRIYYYGNTSDEAYMVMERCPGVKATEFVSARHLEFGEVVEVGLQLADALRACHGAGVLYRDLYPGNVLIERGLRPRASLFDFDASLVSSHFYACLAERYGTPPEKRIEPARDIDLRRKDYVAPEVRAGEPFSEANDVFALGLLLYRLLTGARPFAATKDDVLTRPSERVENCPDALDDLLCRMLTSEPKTRPNMDEVIRSLKEAELEVRGELPEARGKDEAPAAPPPTSPPQGPPVPVNTRPAAERARGWTMFMAATDGEVVGNAGPSAPIGKPKKNRGWISGLFLLGGVLAFGFGLSMIGPPRISDTSSEVAPPATLTPPTEHPHPRDDRQDRAKQQHEVTPESAPVSPPRPALDSVPKTVTSAAPDASAPRSQPLRGGRTATRKTAATVEAAAEGVRPKLKRCVGIPDRFTVEIGVSHGHGSVRSVNGLPPAETGWQACARRELEQAPYPADAPTAPVRLRIQL